MHWSYHTIKIIREINYNAPYIIVELKHVRSNRYISCYLNFLFLLKTQCVMIWHYFILCHHLPCCLLCIRSYPTLPECLCSAFPPPGPNSLSTLTCFASANTALLKSAVQLYTLNSVSCLHFICQVARLCTCYVCELVYCIVVCLNCAWLFFLSSPVLSVCWLVGV